LFAANTGPTAHPRALLVAGLALQALLVAFVLLYVNVPIDYDVPFGLSRESPALFRIVWPYPTVTLAPGTFRTVATLVMVALWGVYLAAWTIARRSLPMSRRRRVIAVIATLSVGFHVTLALAMPPVLSADIYHYALFGRMVAFYGLNPYVLPGTVVSGDPIWPWVYWRDVTTHYGPAWTLLSAGAAAWGARVCSRRCSVSR
jgi:hypothetical protein